MVMDLFMSDLIDSSLQVHCCRIETSKGVPIGWTGWPQPDRKPTGSMRTCARCTRSGPVPHIYQLAPMSCTTAAATSLPITDWECLFLSVVSLTCSSCAAATLFQHENTRTLALAEHIRSFVQLAFVGSVYLLLTLFVCWHRYTSAFCLFSGFCFPSSFEK